MTIISTFWIGEDNPDTEIKPTTLAKGQKYGVIKENI